ncbi:RelA/SpoT domain-containing protein [Anabaena sp. FACHB-1237]|uniref:RelA/SpoT domain-containing protein n=1 Tax=Anabaena sp. FACHB-1237 TaxID=2692769 RepID=UPI001F553953|nr:RelA/SpoT domain-containing protein [Anabaena sp. FACHB-1237]
MIFQIDNTSHTDIVLVDSDHQYLDTTMWIEPEFSKKQIRKAGESLIGKDEKIGIDDALIILSNWRGSHAYPLNSVQNSLRYRAKQLDNDYIITQRLKRASSIKDKLNRFPDMKLDRIQDIGGCRAILSNTQLVYQLREDIINMQSVNIIKEYDYIEKPKESGYRGIHLISQYCGKQSIFEGLRIEIQIRNKIQHYWATAVEIIDRFTNQQLKSGLEDNKWVLFFKLMSLLMTDIEKGKTINLEYAKQLKNLENELKVKEKLTNYSVFVNWTENEEKRKGKFLLMLDTNKRTISVEYFNDRQLLEATKNYAHLEKQFEEKNIDIVLVEAKSIQELKKGYPNYFADSSAFTGYLSYCINQVSE